MCTIHLCGLVLISDHDVRATCAVMVWYIKFLINDGQMLTYN